VTSTTSSLLASNEPIDPKSMGNREDALTRLATGKLKWGVIYPHKESNDIADGAETDEVGHLAFGGPGQEIGLPEEGRVYAG
jgi:hypothetical protein